MKAYKVVKKVNEKYISCGSGLKEKHALVLEYKEGEITVAWEGTVGIFIFTDLLSAIEHFDRACGIGINISIFEVETLSKVYRLHKVVSHLSFLKHFTFNRLEYKQRLESIHGYYDYNIPHGTRVCKKIRVGKLIKGGANESL